MHDYERAVIRAGMLKNRLAELTYPAGDGALKEVQRLVWDYADELKALNFPPEQVILAVKRAANGAGLSDALRFEGGRSGEGKDELLANMVRWCIERYYQSPDAYARA